MTFRDRMKVSVSRAEIQVLNGLVARGLTRLLETQKGFEFILHMDRVAGTRVDFYYNPPIKYAVFLDGPPHLRHRQSERDELVSAALENRGVKVDRFRYVPPLRKYRLREICDRIEETLAGRGYPTHLKEKEEPRNV